MKYQCDIPGFEECFIDVSERWTRGETSAFFELRDEAYLALISKKIVALHLVAEPPTGVITEPAQLTPAAVNDIDMMLWKWFSTALNKAVDDLYALGKAHASRWLSAQESATTPGASPKPK